MAFPHHTHSYINGLTDVELKRAKNEDIEEKKLTEENKTFRQQIDDVKQKFRKSFYAYKPG